MPQTELQQTDHADTLSFQAGVEGFLNVDCMKISEQEGTISFQADVGVNPGTASVQVAARLDFTKLLIGRQQQVTALIEQNKQFDPGGNGCFIPFCRELDFFVSLH